MPLDLLPYEIFQLISLSLVSNKQDLTECCVVCTSWYSRFMQQLYQDIHVCGPPKFKLFYTCLVNTTSYTHYLIRTLTVQDGDISQEEMDQLPRICPRLEQLTIDGRAHWESSNKQGLEVVVMDSETRWWPYLKSACILVTSITPNLIQNAPQLTRLTLRCMFDAILTNEIISLLIRTPLLEYLSMDEIQISMNHLEIIHAACPQLEQLRLIHPTLIQRQQQQQEMDRINPSSSSLEQLVLQEVCLETGLLEWFTYIGKKYPRLEKLEWWNKAIHGESTLCHLDTLTALNLIKQCPRLNSVRFFHLDVNPLFYQSLASRTQYNHNTCLTELGMSFSMDLGHYSDQILSYSLWWQIKESPFIYIPRLPHFLVKLHLSARLCFGSFDMTLLLNQCTRLESLHLDFGTLENTITTTTTTTTQRTLHPLKKLVMEEVSFSSSLITMLSWRCRDLTDLDLLDCIIMDEPEDGNKNLASLIFPHQHFQTVKLCGIRFAPNPSLRAKSVGVYEMDRQPQQEQWYYLSHHATYLSYTPIHYFRYKLPVQAIKQHSIIKPLPSQPLLVPPTELNVLRQMQRQDGKFGRDAPCAGYLTLTCRSIRSLYLENRRI